jgi:CRP/FNR family transcriptional regulator, anaerobic regulatory protein
MDAQAAIRSLWGLRMVGVQLESIPYRDYASALFGSRKRFAVNAAEQRELGQLGHRISFRKKQTIFTEDEPAKAVYQLTHGTAVLYKMTANGRRQIVGFALPGNFLGSPFQDCCSCSVDAISQVRASRFFTGPFLAFIRSHPVSLCQMFEAVLLESNAARDHMLLLGRGTAEERFVEFILNWRNRVAHIDAPTNLVSLPMSRTDIADFLGLTLETVSRVVAKLEREKVVRAVPKGLQLMGPTERPLLYERSYKVPEVR